MAEPITRAQPGLTFIAPQFNPTVQTAVKVLLPWFTRHWSNLTRIEVDQAEHLAAMYEQFQAEKTRFLIAFRHPSVHDPFCLAHLLYQSVPRVARQQGLNLPSRIHAHFIYDRGIPLWAGAFMGWLYAQLGGVPILRGKVDRQGLRTARQLFVDGQFPLIAAPEGGTNGHGEIVSPLEPGIAQLGFWCAEDLAKAGRSEAVFIVPVGIQYRYVSPPWEAIRQLLVELEQAVGIDQALEPDFSSEPEICDRIQAMAEPEQKLYLRLYRLGEHLLTSMEEFYQQYYHQSLTSHPEHSATIRQPLSDRLNRLLDTALSVSETYFKLSPKGTVIDRCRRLEQAGWDWIYRDELNNLNQISVLERGLADIVAAEASLRMWHMRIVESFVAVTGNYVSEKPTVERFAETLLLLWDVITRIQGQPPHLKRPHLGKQIAQVSVGSPISVSDRWPAYQTSRRHAKSAVEELTQDLQEALTAMASKR